MIIDFISNVFPPLRPVLDSMVVQLVDGGSWLDYR